MSSDERQIRVALDSLYVMRWLAATIETEPETAEAISIVARTEGWVKTAALMIGETITGTKLQAVVDGSTVTIVMVEESTPSTTSTPS